MSRIALITGQVSPFQVELARFINAEPDTDYRVFFNAAQSARPKYWQDLGPQIDRYCSLYTTDTSTTADFVSWTVQELTDFKPDVIISGGIRGDVPAVAFDYRNKHDPSVRIGAWMEGPLHQKSILKRALRFADYWLRLKKFDFIFSIGDRAHAYHRRCNGNTYFVPYGADLSVCFENPLPRRPREKMIFLFSGGLHVRHNFDLVMNGFRILHERRGPVFEFVISGQGPEQARIEAFLETYPPLRDLVRYDFEFDNWDARLRPFLEADVKIYPTQHAGWGLVVPEAMAAGCLVISSRGAEASRYLVTHEENGLLVETDDESFAEALLRCVDDPEWTRSIGIAARVSALRGHGPAVARQFRDSLRIATQGEI